VRPLATDDGGLERSLHGFFLGGRREKPRIKARRCEHCQRTMRACG
jgi:hypothetical protein